MKGKGRYEFFHSFYSILSLSLSFFTFSSHWGLTSEYHFQYSNSMDVCPYSDIGKVFGLKKYILFLWQSHHICNICMY